MDRTNICTPLGCLHHQRLNKCNLQKEQNKEKIYFLDVKGGKHPQFFRCCTKEQRTLFLVTINDQICVSFSDPALWNADLESALNKKWIFGLKKPHAVLAAQPLRTDVPAGELGWRPGSPRCTFQVKLLLRDVMCLITLTRDGSLSGNKMCSWWWVTEKYSLISSWSPKEKKKSGCCVPSCGGMGF